MWPAGERRRLQQESAAAGLPGVQEQLRVLFPATAQPAGMLTAFVNNVSGLPQFSPADIFSCRHDYYTSAPNLDVSGHVKSIGLGLLGGLNIAIVSKLGL